MLTIPITIASTKRGFSKLIILKSYLRSTMSQEWLNGLTIERDILTNLECKNLINNFVSQKAKKIDFKLKKN